MSNSILRSRKISLKEIIESIICKCSKKEKLKIIGKCEDFIEVTMSLNYIINKLFEINFLKSILFSEKEKKVFDFQNKKLINLSNAKKAEDYLDSLNDIEITKNFDIEGYENIKNNHISLKEKLLDAINNRILL